MTVPTRTHPETALDTAPPGLAWLLSPMPVDHFFATHWETRHLFLGRATPDYFAALPGLPTLYDDVGAKGDMP